MSKKRIYYPLLQVGITKATQCEKCLGAGIMQENTYIGDGFVDTRYVYCDCIAGQEARKSNEKK